jgi:3-phosphoshikimate 1-carboxyvinyltransferase
MISIAVPPGHRLAGTVRVPPSKSATNRALILAAQSEEAVLLRAPLHSADTEALVACLNKMDVRIRREGEDLRVCGPLPAICSPSSRMLERRLDAGESGTAFRFLLALAATTPGRYVLDGAARLRDRPVAELVEALRAIGGRIRYLGAAGHPPLSVEGEELQGGGVFVDVSRSSQFLSALLLVGGRLAHGLRIRVSGDAVSAPYVETTLDLLRCFGVRWEREPDGFHVHPGLPGASEYAVPGDYSSAIALAVAVAVSGGEASLRGLEEPSSQADRAAFDVLAQMGAVLDFAEGTWSVRGGPLRCVDVRAADFPDAVPVLAAAAAFGSGASVFRGVGHLRYKESDRLGALVDLLARCGIRAEAPEDALTIFGESDVSAFSGPHTELRDPQLPPLLPTFNDHRIGMAAAILATCRPGVLVEEPGCVRKSYPRFFADLGGLMAR